MPKSLFVLCLVFVLSCCAPNDSTSKSGTRSPIDSNPQQFLPPVKVTDKVEASVELNPWAQSAPPPENRGSDKRARLSLGDVGLDESDALTLIQLAEAGERFETLLPAAKTEFQLELKVGARHYLCRYPDVVVALHELASRKDHFVCYRRKDNRKFLNVDLHKRTLSVLP